MTHDEDGETVSGAVSLEVLPPERFTTMCFWSGHTDDRDCDETTLMADHQPLVSVWAGLGDVDFRSMLLRVNGHEPFAMTAADGPALVVNLGALYPDAAYAGRGRPGDYELRLELAGLTETRVITVR
jgi:hypothetical protein